jgi:hypothetical protein
MALTNYWLRRERLTIYAKIADWAHKHSIMVEKLTRRQIIEAVKYKS